MLSVEERVALLEQANDEKTLREQIAVLKKAVEWLEKERYYLEGRVDVLSEKLYQLEEKYDRLSLAFGILTSYLEREQKEHIEKILRGEYL